MAIQVSGTQVISNSRGLTNIASVDATTAAAIGAAGVGGGGSIELTATGSITAGDPVGINSLGRAQLTAGITGTDTTLTTGLGNQFGMSSCSISSSKTVFFYNKSNSFVARCGVIQTNGTYAFGAETTIYSGATVYYGHSGACPDTGVVCLFFKKGASPFATVVKAVTVTGTNTVNAGSEVSHGANNKNSHCVRPMGNGKFGVFNDSNASIVTISGTSITKNSTVSSTDDIRTCVWDPDTSKFITSSFGYGGRFNSYTVSGTTISYNSYHDHSTGYWDRLLGWYDTASNYMIRVVQDGSNFKIQAWDVSSTAASGFGVIGELSLPASGNDMWHNDLKQNQAVWNESTGTGFAHYKESGTWKLVEIKCSSGGTPSVVNETPVVNDFSVGVGSGIVSTIDVESLSNAKANFFNYGTTLQTFIGFAESSVSDGQTLDVTVDGGINSNQSGLVRGSFYGLTNQALLNKGTKPQVGVAISATELLVSNGRNAS